VEVRRKLFEVLAFEFQNRFNLFVDFFPFGRYKRQNSVALVDPIKIITKSNNKNKFKKKKFSILIKLPQKKKEMCKSSK
jgi:hypothetical protein